MDTVRKKIDRPIGVIIIAVFLVLFGLASFGATFQAIKEAPEIPFGYTVVSLALPVFLAGAAVWAFTGQNEGRIALVIVFGLNWVWPMLFSVGALLDSDSANDEVGVLSVVGLTFRGLWVIAIAWYLLSKRVSEYYHQNDGNQSV